MLISYSHAANRHFHFKETWLYVVQKYLRVTFWLFQKQNRLLLSVVFYFFLSFSFSLFLGILNRYFRWGWAKCVTLFVGPKTKLFKLCSLKSVFFCWRNSVWDQLHLDIGYTLRLLVSNENKRDNQITKSSFSFPVSKWYPKRWQCMLKRREKGRFRSVSQRKL